MVGYRLDQARQLAVLSDLQYSELSAQLTRAVKENEQVCGTVPALCDC